MFIENFIKRNIFEIKSQGILAVVRKIFTLTKIFFLIPIYLISDELVELTNTCLASVRTYLPGATIILVDDGSATFSQEMQDATTLSLQGAYGFVRQTDDVLLLLESP